MSKFFDLFPKVAYDIGKSQNATFQNPTNIFFRIGVVREALENISSYYIYNIQDGDKPEVLAEKVYGTPEAHWIILMANDRLDGAYDWPLNYADFNNYIANKYRDAAAGGTQSLYQLDPLVSSYLTGLGVTITPGITIGDTIAGAIAGGTSMTDSQIIAWSQVAIAGTNGIHHYEKITERTETTSGTTTIKRDIISYNEAIPGDLTTYDNFDYYLNLPDAGAYSTYTVDSKTVKERIYRGFVTIYDYELQKNEDKRLIKIIKPTYYNQIMTELKTILGNTDSLRRILL